MLPRNLLDTRVILSPPLMDCVIATGLLLREYLNEGLEPAVIMGSIDTLRHVKVDSKHLLVCFKTDLLSLYRGSNASVLMVEERYSGLYRIRDALLEPIETVIPPPNSVTSLVARMLRLRSNESEALIMIAEGRSPGIDLEGLGKASMMALLNPSNFYRILEFIREGMIDDVKFLIEELMDKYSENEAKYTSELRGRAVKVNGLTIIYYDVRLPERAYVSEVIDELVKLGHRRVVVLGSAGRLVTKVELIGLSTESSKKIIQVLSNSIEHIIKINDIVKLYLKPPYLAIYDFIKLIKY